ncbi:presenilins-associated rhomboid-like protein, mitochondrial isoform X2 [Belonocnema kinseyi]|nr:presenilins-associated rhomboid-like protein, mitochondrial isoform X2 [Belonocnema kinseyi]
MPVRFWRTFGFTVAISGASIAGAAIWEYEKIRTRTYNLIHHIQLPRIPKRGLRAEAEAWWRNLTPGERIFIPICFLNVLVFIAWRIPAFNKTMNLYFTSNPAARVVGLPMLLSTFSHYSFWHMAINMYVLHNISTPAVQTLGAEQFVAMYLISGVLGNFASHMYKVYLNQAGQSLGASGSIMGVLGYTCTQFPSAELCLIFLPMFTFSASQALKAVIALDLAGAIMRWRVLDHAAHLGGVFTGILWEKWVNANIWQKRKPLLMIWHKFREPPRSN